METTDTLNEVVAARLKEFIADKQLNVRQASLKLGDANSSKLHKILSGSQGPSLPTLVDLATAFPDLSLDWLILGRTPQAPAPLADSLPGTMAPALPASPVVLQRAVTSGRVLAVTVDRTGNENILHIPARAQAGYTHSFDQPQYLQDLTPYSLPMFSSGTFRSFEVEGDSMRPTFEHRDTVIGQFVDRWDMLAPGHCYVVVVDGNVWVKRLQKPVKHRRADVVELISDNRAYPIHEIVAADIVEIWHIRAVLSTNIPASTREVQERMLELLEALGVEQQQTRRILETLAPADAPSPAR